MKMETQLKRDCILGLVGRFFPNGLSEEEIHPLLSHIVPLNLIQTEGGIGQWSGDGSHNLPERSGGVLDHYLGK